ncbi:homeobox protein knotted-1-like 3 isoform X2 [Pyrus x bretschneideri]|uniref:homeobox protein knotted-1-like 3 isoform X2 n=1 Tax=Pyrus x bretschneideri TaxID=225117 RepID=UPI0020305227|nr:homeobox protein knotted-1-like 3 isoform X2 [Pyrus x bretschneideri]
MAYHNHLSQPLHHFTDQTQQQHQQYQSDQTDPTSKPPEPHHPFQPAPNWLHSALLRNFTNADTNPTNTNNANNNGGGSSNFLNLHVTASDSVASQASNQWLSQSHRPILHRNHSDVIDDVTVAGDSMIAAMSHDSADLKPDSNLNKSDGGVVESGIPGGGGGGDGGVINWQNARHKAEILAHPLYEPLLSAHVACLRIATPVDQLPRIDAQLAQSQNVVAKYSALGNGMVGDDKELDQFMRHYVFLLCSFKEQLQQHVRVHAMEAVMACWEIEQSLQSLTGVSPGEGTGATMSDDEDDQVDSDANLFDGSMEGHDSMGFGPLIPTESERSLMERVRQELKHELKQGYKEKIVDIREEIMRKRRAGKLPGDTTSVLKAWWQSHSKWPYPTEEDKARLVQETGLQLKQINNWFINQRKRNWHSNPSTSTVLKSKRKSNAGENSSDDRFI